MGREVKRPRGIYLIPNGFTVGAMFSGFYAMIAAMNGMYETAVIALFVSILLDSLDGRVARLLHSQTDFGAQLDSLSDMLCSGVVPAVIVYHFGLVHLGKPGWLVAFFYTVCTALRLARFNVQLARDDKRYFQGLATPAAAFTVGSLVWVCTIYQFTGLWRDVMLAVVAIVLALLKVSNIRYRSYKDINLHGRVPFIVIITLVLILVFISFDPPDIFLLIMIVYVLSGPIGTLWQIQKKRAKRRRSKKRVDSD